MLTDIHQTRENQSILISEMSDSHLQNTINMYCKRILETRMSILNLKHDIGKYGNSYKYDIADVAIDNDIEINIEHQTYMLKSLHSKLKSLVLEAVVRSGFDLSQVVLAYN